MQQARWISSIAHLFPQPETPITTIQGSGRICIFNSTAEEHRRSNILSDQLLPATIQVLFLEILLITQCKTSWISSLKTNRPNALQSVALCLDLKSCTVARAGRHVHAADGVVPLILGQSPLLAFLFFQIFSTRASRLC